MKNLWMLLLFLILTSGYSQAQETRVWTLGDPTDGKKSDGPGTGTRAGEKKTVTIKGINYTFCWCPSGTFMMGSPESEKGRFGFGSETQLVVTLTKGFWLLEHEET